MDVLPSLIEQLPAFLGGHMRLSLAAILCALVIALPLGVLAARYRQIAAPAVTIASVLQTIPGLALLALMVPLFGGQIGFAPAFAALTLYGILPVLRNTIVGLQEVDPGVREAARGIGMSVIQRLVRVELPLAAPVVVAGVRTASVWVVGAATLATPVGATSLGNYIFQGLQTRTWEAVIFGCICSAGLAILLDQLIRALHLAAFSRRFMRAAFAGLAMIAIPGGAIVGAGLYSGSMSNAAVTAAQSEAAGFGDRPVTIGAKAFTEQYILAELIEQELVDAGADVARLDNLGSTVAFDALASGEIDILVDYTGTLWATVMGEGAPISRHRMSAAITAWLYDSHAIVALGQLGFENAYGLAVRRDFAETHSLRSVSDLSDLEGLRIGADPEFFARSEWQRVRTLYTMSNPEQRAMDATFMYDAVRDGQVDVITAYTTDGRISAYDLVVLEDQLGALPPYDAVVLLSERASKLPEIARTLAPLIGAVSAEDMRSANGAVDQDGQTVEQAATRLRASIAN